MKERDNFHAPHTARPAVWSKLRWVVLLLFVAGVFIAAVELEVIASTANVVESNVSSNYKDGHDLLTVNYLTDSAAASEATIYDPGSVLSVVPAIAFVQNSSPRIMWLQVSGGEEYDNLIKGETYHIYVDSLDGPPADDIYRQMNNSAIVPVSVPGRPRYDTNSLYITVNDLDISAPSFLPFLRTANFTCDLTYWCYSRIYSQRTYWDHRCFGSGILEGSVSVSGLHSRKQLEVEVWKAVNQDVGRHAVGMLRAYYANMYLNPAHP